MEQRPETANVRVGRRLGAVIAALTLAAVFGPPTSASALAATVSQVEASNESLFTRVGDFASDNATWFVIGAIGLAFILAAFFIIRAGRKGDKATPATRGKAPAGPKANPPAVAAGAGAAGGQVSAAEMKRRRRAAMQRAREEERLRRKGAKGAPPQPPAQLDPIEAEKAAARGEAPPARPAQKPPVPPVAPEAQTAVTPPAAATAAGAVAAGGVAGAMAGRTENPDAEQRLREKVEQIKAGQSGAPVQPPPSSGVAPTPEAVPGATPIPPGGPGGLGQVAPDLADAERRLQTDRAAREQVLGQAEVRLQELEARAEAAERRAAFAEQLANLRAEEGEHERRLNEVLSRIEQAEQRAQLAEVRAEAAERTASEALRGGAAVPPGVAAPGSPLAPAPPSPIAPSPPIPSVQPPPAAPASGAQAAPGGPVNINTAGFEELRSVDLSVTQATRVMAYRERFGGYASIEDLARVPGFTPDVLQALQGRVTA